MSTSAYAELETRFRRLSDIEGALAVLSWDQSTQMPDGGARVRGRQSATLSVLAHDMLTDPALADLLADSHNETLDDWQTANRDEMARARLAATAIPADLVGHMEEARAATEMAWRAAREAADFSIVAAELDTLLGLVRHSATCLAQAKGLALYDALLDQFDPGLTFDFVEPLFDQLEAFLPPLVDRIITAQAAGPAAVLPEGDFAQKTQEAFGRDLMAGLGFDFNRGRLDVSHHPFSGGVPDDCRITTRYDEHDFTSGLMGIIHETGHALYEQGLPAKWRGQPVGRARGMTMHESQSLIMEMQLARSAAVIAWLAPRLADAYGGTGPAWSADNLQRLYLRVSRGPIRVDADEVSYPLHVIVRTRLERALLTGDLAVADLPAAWNDGMKTTLGIVPQDDARGCLQDIHWYMGALGYFPTYTLGALTAAQMKAHIAGSAPESLAAAGTGDFSPLVAWLRTHVHQLGSRYGTAELIERATGAALAIAPFKAHLIARYLDQTGEPDPKMKYVSTRGEAPTLGFDDVLLKGLAGDGGLYVPAQWPRLSHDDLARLRRLDYEDLAFEVMRPFVGETIGDEAFRGHIKAAYAGFNHRSVTPLVQSGTEEWILELHHGPTLAFKDVAMQLLGRLMDHVLGARKTRATIVCATSGDTGGAAVDAFAGAERADLFVLLPKGRVSEVQRRMMTTNDAPNVYALEIDGNFDDCQGIVKAMFAHDSFREQVALSGVNSINWARIVAQTVYYFAAALALGGPDRKISFTVPTGNFGDIFAAYVAKRMGLPIDRLVIATNVNDILARTFAGGHHEKTGVRPTSSPSMDIEVSSNFERLVFDLVGRDPALVRRLMAGLGQSGSFTLPAAALKGLRAQFDAGSADEAQTAAMIARIHQDIGMLIDPHTAVALHVARSRSQVPDGDHSPMVVLSTAHAAKFPDAVQAACGIRPALPPAFGRLMEKPERLTPLPNDLSAVEAFILEQSRVSPKT